MATASSPSSTERNPAHSLSAPDTSVSVRDAFNIDVDLDVPAFSEASEYVPDRDDSYVFDRDTTLAILAGFAHNRRVMIQGYHGTGKSTHIEQIAARPNWAETSRTVSVVGLNVCSSRAVILSWRDDGSISCGLQAPLMMPEYQWAKPCNSLPEAYSNMDDKEEF